MIILDSDVLIEILDKGSLRGDESLRKILEHGGEIAVTSVALHEVLYGLIKYGKQTSEVLNLPVLGFEREDAALAARLEVEAKKRGKPVRRIDAMIAAVAINHKAKLYTFDQKHYRVFQPFGLALLH